jgi:hypothetical protein
MGLERGASLMDLDRDTAQQFALMLSSGMPSMDAITYFLEEEVAPDYAKFQHDRWMRSREVQKAIVTIQGRSWQDMTLEQRIRHSMDKHYSELAYYLYSHNYSDLSGAGKQKADTCRLALEAKLSGMAGKMDPLSRFWDDVLAGRVTTPKTAEIISQPTMSAGPNTSFPPHVS